LWGGIIFKISVAKVFIRGENSYLMGDKITAPVKKAGFIVKMTRN
jgi:hypothetical protein